MSNLSTPKEIKGYIEEMIILDETKELLKYSFSNNIDDIEIAIFDRTGLDIKLDRAYWRFNNSLSANVRHLMKKYNVIYGMTVYENSKKSIVINVHANGRWLITGYDKYKGEYKNWETIEKICLLEKFIKYFNSEDDDNTE